MKQIKQAIATVATLLLAGCASGPDRVAIDEEGKRNATSCCTDSRHLPQAQEFSGRLAVNLAPGLPHFNFGVGLSPFVRLTLPSTSPGAVVAAYANTPGTGILLGGEATIRYVEPQIVFLSESGDAIPTAEDTGLSVRVFEGKSALGRIVRIPVGAKSVLVSSAANSSGTTRTTLSSSQAGTYIIGGVPVSAPSIQHRLQYTAHTYGPIVIALGTYVQK